MKRKLYMIAVILLVATSLEAQERENNIITDRPDVAESSVVVGKNRFQWETGFQWNSDKVGTTTTRNYNFPTLFRYGVIDWLEARVEGNMIQFQTQTGASTQTGFTDLAFAVKGHLWDNDKWIPSFGLLLSALTPTGKNSFSTNVVEPALKLLADWELPADFAFSANIGFDVPARNGAREKFARLLHATSLVKILPVRQKKFAVFAEMQGVMPVQSSSPNIHTFDTGLTFLLNKDMQLDLSSQIALGNAAADLAMGVGFSWRVL